MATSGPGHRPYLPDESAAAGDYSGPDRRLTPCDEDDVEPVILTKKLADELDGVKVSGRDVGDRLCLATGEAAMLVAEGWAEPAAPERRRGGR